MINVDTALQEAGTGVADAAAGARRALFEVAPGERDALEAVVREQMGAYPLDVPLEVRCWVRPQLGHRGALERSPVRKGVTCRSRGPVGSRQWVVIAG